MDKDFPRFLFPNVKDKLLADEKSSGWSSTPGDQDNFDNFDQYGICERIIKLNYSYPVRIEFESAEQTSVRPARPIDEDEEDDQDKVAPPQDGSKIRCFTHKYQSSDFVRSITSVMPWRLYSNDLRPST